ncbi:MAG: lactate racemase domain-containing protein, partial [Anaerolineae bacterium]|nr:lactate racemase domain-containing protein [Anaerolineae bacterium]
MWHEEVVSIAFPYAGIEALEVPKASLLGVYSPREAGAGPPAASLTERALSSPIASPPLQQLAGRGQKVLVLCDDYTRPTPVAEMLPPVLAELRGAGVSQKDVSILVASGTHRRMTRRELARKLGRAILSEYRVLQHDWRDEESLVPLGETSGGLPVVANRHLLEADLVIGLGHVVPHRITGYSGGAKIIGPGVTGAALSPTEMHWLAAQVPAREL